MNQILAISNYLKSGNSLTALEALNMFGCMNLKGRIWDIKQFMPVEKKMIMLESGKRVARYYVPKIIKENLFEV